MWLLEWNDVLCCPNYMAVLISIGVILIGCKLFKWFMVNRTTQQLLLRKYISKSIDTHHRFYLEHTIISLRPAQFSAVSGESINVLTDTPLICEYCNIIIFNTNHEIKHANKHIKCKQLGILNGNGNRKASGLPSGDSNPNLLRPPVTQFNHHWVHGNLPLSSVCIVCNKTCGNGQKLIDFHCVWCNAASHEDPNCFKQMQDEEYGCFELAFKSLKLQFLVPYPCIRLAKLSKNKKLTVIRRCDPLVLPDRLYSPSSLLKNESWTPLIVIINSKSGGSGIDYSDSLKRLFCLHLNPLQVFDLANCTPGEALKWLQLLPTTTFVILIAGGDGTITWVLDTYAGLKADDDNITADSIFTLLPLGTGNDLARCLGWMNFDCSDQEADNEIKSENDSRKSDDMILLENFNFSRYIRKLVQCEVTTMDRFRCEIEYQRRESSFRRSPIRSAKPRRAVKHFQNYFGVGVDALVAYNFEKQRRKWPFAFNKFQVLNKLWYLVFGTKDVFDHKCFNLTDEVELYLDDILVEGLPTLEGIVVISIDHWGGGSDVIKAIEDLEPFVKSSIAGEKRFKKSHHSISDGIVEVFGLYSSFHCAKIKMNMFEPPLLIGRARKVSMELRKDPSNGTGRTKLPVQIDGEAWWQDLPSSVTITQPIMNDGRRHQVRVLRST